MSLPIVFRPEARAELVEAWTWYEEQRPGLGDEMAACVESAVAGAARSPEAHPPVSGEVRRVLVRRFPYGVFYVVDSGELLVLPVARARRRPQYWRDRVAKGSS